MQSLTTKTSSVVLIACATLALSGCAAGGSSQSSITALTPGSTSQSRAPNLGVRAQAQQAFFPLRTTHRAVAHDRGPGWLSKQAAGGTGLLYVGDFDGSVVNVYNRRGVNPAQVGQISEGISNPERLFVDAAGSLYVTNSASITVYPKGTTAPSLTISDGVNGPTGVTVDAAGTVYSANTGTDTVTEYPAGATSPSTTLSIPGTPENLAVDGAGNLYVAGFFGSISGVYEYAPGSTTGTDLGIRVSFIGGVEVDRSGGLAVADLGSNVIDLYLAGQAQPYRQIGLSGAPFELAMNKNQGQLYASVLPGSSFAVQRVGYPSGNPAAKLDSAGESGWPLAVSPDNVQ